jgi:DNA-directed RNA polymerase specialized sigma24 family protein
MPPVTALTTVSAARDPDAPYEWFVDVVAELKRIHPAEAAALTATYFHGMSHAEAAAHLGREITEVDRLVARGLIQLGTALGATERFTIGLASTA